MADDQDQVDTVQFQDSDGVRWEVREIRPSELRNSSGLGLAFGDFGRGWLLFISATGQRRRLPTPFPPGWRRLPPDGLEALMSRARMATPSTPHAALADVAPREPASDDAVPRPLFRATGAERADEHRADSR